MCARLVRVKAFARALWADTDGIILPYVTVMLVVIVGVSVLAVDGARMVSLQTQLQKAADAYALAGAAELDRLPTAISRAGRAINNLVANRTLGGMGNQLVTVSSIRFLDYSQLPASDASPVTSVLCTYPGCTADNAVAARFIEVTVQPVTLPTILPASFFGGAATATAGASAVAGNAAVACKFIPMFICNPFEESGMTDDQATQALVDAIDDPNIRRRLISLKNDGSYGPGNYGYLNTSLGNGANALIDAIARVNPAVCLNQNSVNTQPGSINAAREGFNVRFDIYNGSMNSKKGLSDYRPAQNVRKGYVGANACNASPYDSSTWPGPPNGALPRDGCFATNTCPYMGGRMGDGSWDCATYWVANHTATAAPAGCTSTATVSRYQVYRYEIENGLTGDANLLTGETGNPGCYTGGSGTLSDDPDRRLLHVAIVNCGALNLNGNQPDVPVAAFGKFFITNPVQAGGDQEVDAELVELAVPGPSSGGVIYDQVQLYR